ncbi:MBL fold metallo-hydrolase [Paraglaciecola aquimarina]|uniref:MBL fold metallo-hydrolase n=1 Tax=Paraglaciecola aquimarina TaxID=1235557 RepID=A0ABU3T0Y2_9ALTE|nr:MBL fold metallo-hydrolase [Paraglaciecola aquimarina]MDU0355930.1 MBL fold metallo-hydrolase [Paraglaciecola aquimarina]
MKKLVLVSLGVLVMLFTFCQSQPKQTEVLHSEQFNAGKFHNKKQFENMGLADLPAYIHRYFSEKRVDISPEKPIPVQQITQQVLATLPENSFTLFRLGHSSFLIKVKQAYWLIDPVFSERASPFSFMGPKRFHETPIDIEALPDIEGVIISHNHYDHLDKAAIKALNGKVGKYVVPLALGNDLRDWGVAADNIIELDWWQSAQVGELSLTSTPAQHFSGRGLSDGNKTLWSSWVIKNQDNSLFYSGDSGYFDGFAEIGKQYGPFDLTIIETGAYDKDWPDVHMTPEQSLQAHLDVRGGKMLPAHNGTFDLAFHPWHEPFERIVDLAKQFQVDIITPIVGEPIDIKENNSRVAWWRGLN